MDVGVPDAQDDPEWESRAAFAPGGAVLTPATAFALDAEVTNDTTGQFYDVRSPAAHRHGQRAVLRATLRLTTSLGLGLYNLLDTPQGTPRRPTSRFRARIRYDALTYGVSSGAETDRHESRRIFRPSSARPRPAAGRPDVRLHRGRRRFAGGWPRLQGGPQQYVTDVLGWWAFDGGEVSVSTPYYLKAEVYGGLEERGGMPLSTPRFEAAGVWVGSRSGYDPSLYPQFQPARLAPAFAVALETTGVTWIHGRLTYRRVYNEGGSNTSEFASGLYPPAVYDTSRISSERLGYAVDASFGGIGGAKAGIVYDFYRGDLTSIYGSLDAYVTPKVTLSANYDYYVPSFDGDSIWNFFAGEPTNDVGLRANVDVDDRLSVAGGAHVRVYSVQTAAFDATCPAGVQCTPSANYDAAATYFPTNGHPFDEGGDVRARWRTPETKLALQATGAWGDEGDRVGADLSGEHVIQSRYVASARTGVWAWTDKLREDRSTTTFNYVLGIGYRFAPRSQGGIEWEHDISGLVGQRFRLMLMLTLAASK